MNPVYTWPGAVLSAIFAAVLLVAWLDVRRRACPEHVLTMTVLVVVWLLGAVYLHSVRLAYLGGAIGPATVDLLASVGAVGVNVALDLGALWYLSRHWVARWQWFVMLCFVGMLAAHSAISWALLAGQGSANLAAYLHGITGLSYAAIIITWGASRLAHLGKRSGDRHDMGVSRPLGRLGRWAFSRVRHPDPRTT